MTAQSVSQDAPKSGFSLYDPRIRGIVYQVVLLGILVAVVYTPCSTWRSSAFR